MVWVLWGFLGGQFVFVFVEHNPCSEQTFHVCSLVTRQYSICLDKYFITAIFTVKQSNSNNQTLIILRINLSLKSCYEFSIQV